MQTPIGFIISWQVPSTVALADLRRGISKTGLDTFDLAPDLDPASIVARSAGLVAKLASAKDVKRLARKVEHKTRQITREDHDAATGLTYTREMTLSFDDATHALVDDAGVPQSAIQYEIETSRRASDVTRIIQRIVEQAGSDLIPVRKQGGAYFVPAGHVVIDKVRTVIEHVAGRLDTFACTIGHGDAANQTGQSVANVITDYLLGQIEELKEAVAELNEGSIRSDVKSRRLSRVAELKDRLANYASLLGAQHGTVSTALDQAEDALLAKLGPETSEPAVDEKEAAFLTSIEVADDVERDDATVEVVP